MLYLLQFYLLQIFDVYTKYTIKVTPNIWGKNNLMK